jgi:hypothetical protein
MAEFHTYMTLDCPPALAESDPEKQSVVDAVKATVGGFGWVGGWLTGWVGVWALVLDVVGLPGI